MLTTLAGCQLGPTATPTAPPPTGVPAAVTAAATRTAASTPTPAAPGTIAALATATRAIPAGAAGTATRPPVGTPSAAATPVAGAVCAFTPPFAGTSATPGTRPSPSVALPTVTGAGAPTQTPPTIPLPNLAARYTLAIDEFDFAEGRLRTAQTVRVTNRESCALDRLTFSVTAARWGWFSLSGVRVAGQPVAAALNGTVLPIVLPQPLAAGATTEIAIDFRLDVGIAVDPYTPGGFPGTTQTGDILRLAYWFPILSDDHQYPPYLDPAYTASADYDVTLTTPPEVVVAPTGAITDERRNANGTVTRRIEARNVRDFVLALSPNYQVARRQTVNGIMDDAVLAEERLSALIGPYPYPFLRVVDGGANLGGGIEFPALIMVNLNYGSTELIYHEVGHEWFYGLLGTRTQQDPWIDEGGATFLAEYLGGSVTTTPAPPSSFAYRLSTPVWAIPPGRFQGAATAAIYTQGGEFYARVMRQMGEPAFWSALQGLYREHRYGIITPRDILAAWQAASPTDLRPLFKEYLDYPWIDELGR
jgi:hypothetical protein